MSSSLDEVFVLESDIPKASSPVSQHLLNTYASEVNKLVSVWRGFSPGDLAYRPHPRSTIVGDIFKHELLSSRRFFGEFLGLPEPSAAEVLPAAPDPEDYCRRLVEVALTRLNFLANQSERWWLQAVPFFDVDRERIWIFLRRILHTAHHRTQLTVYLRLLDRKVPPVYGPTADVNWGAADPTVNIEAAERKAT